MLIPFEQLPDSSKIWIYQSNRPFNSSELQTLDAALSTFVSTWTAHEQPLNAGFKIANESCIILAVDETLVQASGCSIDRSVNFFKVVEEELSASLFDRMTIAYETESHAIEIVNFNNIQTLISSGIINGNTIVYNNGIYTKADLKDKWRLPLNQTWMAKHFEMASLNA